MPPKRGKKGKRRGDSSSDDDASASAAAAVTASLKQPDGSAEAENAAGKAAGKQARGKAKGKKKGKGGRNNNESDSDDGDALDPLAHLRGGRGKGGKRGGLDSDDDEERPKKPLTKKEKRRLEEEQRRREKEVRRLKAGVRNGATAVECISHGVNEFCHHRHVRNAYLVQMYMRLFVERRQRPLEPQPPLPALGLNLATPSRPAAAVRVRERVQGLGLGLHPVWSDVPCLLFGGERNRVDTLLCWRLGSTTYMRTVPPTSVRLRTEFGFAHVHVVVSATHDMQTSPRARSGVSAVICAGKLFAGYISRL